LKKNCVSKNVRRGRELKTAAAGLYTGNNPPGTIPCRVIYKQEDKLKKLRSLEGSKKNGSI
jgi:hypothetical protein